MGRPGAAGGRSLARRSSAGGGGEERQRSAHGASPSPATLAWLLLLAALSTPVQVAEAVGQWRLPLGLWVSAYIQRPAAKRRCELRRPGGSPRQLVEAAPTWLVNSKACSFVNAGRLHAALLRRWHGPVQVRGPHTCRACLGTLPASPRGCAGPGKNRPCGSAPQPFEFAAAHPQVLACNGVSWGQRVRVGRPAVPHHRQRGRLGPRGPDGGGLAC